MVQYGFNLTLNDVQEIHLEETPYSHHWISSINEIYLHTNRNCREGKDSCTDQPVRDKALSWKWALWNMKPGGRLAFCEPQNKAPLGRGSQRPLATATLGIHGWARGSLLFRGASLNSDLAKSRGGSRPLHFEKLAPWVFIRILRSAQLFEERRGEKGRKPSFL